MKILLLVIVTMISFSCTVSKPRSNPIDRMQWLVGSWEGTYNSKPFYEAWRRINDSALINFSIEIKNSDTIVKENGVLRMERGEGVFRGATDSWKLLSLTDSSLVLANDTLKYANRITWIHTKNDHWWTVIKNPKSTITYDIVRVKWLDAIIDNYIRRRGR